MDRTEISRLADAYEMALKELRSIVGNRLSKEEFCIQAEVKHILNAKYTNFITVQGDDGLEMQFKIQHDLASQLEINHTYLFTGYFEVGSRARFGALQFKAHSFEPVGGSFVTMQQQAATKEIIEGELFNKYKDDFSGFFGQSYCKVGLVTSPVSKAIADVEAVFKKRSGIEMELFQVKLNSVESIVSGIYAACESLCDVIMIVRGGGKETDFGVFNSVEVATAINASAIPIITGLGHTANLTSADHIADRSENTPTKAAQFLVDRLGQVRSYGYELATIKEKAGSYQYGNVLKERNDVEYQYTADKSPDSNRRKEKKPSMAIFITIAVILLCFYYFITR
ncbi:exodeoxyribonuclease VII large subunit [Paenibacillus polymyxa]|uniref:exodeoxyribonuclease VII large subunit n=1 Tax=Paenibacillus polymyxa TaxID=1406 RepID=UPI002AB58A76|nr:exodeoxyribonuclease VII large subunit [Paenibacillus polymyxa]MDY7989828.1 exodeoxyribonuclease VII large subunit [Paenibacillus polymyxa]MDY8116813.1 exodeoxyribonuclease VII large subunit [Paenibacillus polymyxa]